MTAHASVRFYDPFTLDAYDNYLGRFVIIVPAIDPGDWTAGDGFTNELDIVVEDPDDSSYVWDIYLYTNTNGSISDATVIAGFTFDNNSPTIWDGWGAYRVLKSDYNTYGYTFPYGGIYDGANNGPFATHVVTDLDAASDPDWNSAGPPLSPGPTIVTPASGAIIPLVGEGSDTLTISWTLGVTQTAFDVRIVGDSAGSPNLSDTWVHVGPAVTGYTNTVATLPWYRNGPMHVLVRCRAAGYDWSAWSEVPVTIDAQLGTVNCLANEILGDDPFGYWRFDQFDVNNQFPDLAGVGAEPFTLHDNAPGGLNIGTAFYFGNPGSGAHTVSLVGHETGSDMLLFVSIPADSVSAVDCSVSPAWTLHDDTGIVAGAFFNEYGRWKAYRRTKIAGEDSFDITFINVPTSAFFEVRAVVVSVAPPFGFTTVGVWDVQEFMASHTFIGTAAGTATHVGRVSAQFMGVGAPSNELGGGLSGSGFDPPEATTFMYAGLTNLVAIGDSTQLRWECGGSISYGPIGILPFTTDAFDDTAGVRDEQTPAPVCDSLCVDINEFTHIGEHWQGADHTGDPVMPVLHCEKFVSDDTVFGLNDFTLEYVIRIDDNPLGNTEISGMLFNAGFAQVGLAANPVDGPFFEPLYDGTYGQSVANPPTISVGSWYHIVDMGEGNRHITYVNGVEINNRVVSFVEIGGTTSTDVFRNASVLYIATYSHALSHGRVLAHWSHICSTKNWSVGMIRF